MAGDAVTFPSGDDTIGGFVATPRAAGPAVLLIPDVHGLSDHYRDVAQRFAQEGFVTLVIDLYTREGKPTLTDFEAVTRWIDGLDDRRVLADLDAGVRYLGGRADVDPARIGITGFCLGGQYAILAACQVPGLAACVSWYGMLRYREHRPHKPAAPLDVADRLACPYLGFFGADDALIPRADVDELRERLAAAGRDAEIHVYDGAGHAFYNDTRPDAYRPEVAADAFRRCVAFFRTHL